MILDAATKSVQIVLAAAKTANDCPYTASYIDGSITAYTPTPAYGTTNGVTAVDVVVGPSTFQRRLQELTLYNADTAPVIATIRYNNNGTTYIHWKGTLQVGDSLVYTIGTGFFVIDQSGNQKVIQVRGTNDIIRMPGISIDGGSASPSTGQKGYLYIPFACTIKAVTLIADAAGSAVIDIWKAAYPTVPTVANTIVASAKPTLSSVQKNQDTTLTGWTTAITAGDVLGFNLDSVTTVKRVSLVLTVWTT